MNHTASLKIHRIKKYGHLHLPTLIISLAVSLCAVILLGSTLKASQRDKAILEAEAELTNLSQIITLCTNATNAMAKVVSFGEGDISDFTVLAQEIFDENPILQSVQIAPAGKVSYIYPEQGNEAGKIDLFADPNRRAESLKARDSGKLVIAGPFTLKQGGFGIAVRQPVYLKKGDLFSFWGFAIVIVKMDTLLEKAGFNSIGEFGYQYLLTADVNEEEVYVSGNEAVRRSGIHISREIGGKKWDMYVKESILWQIQILYYGIALLLLLDSFIFSWLRGRNLTLSDKNLTDPLTGIRNRRGFNHALQDMLESDSVSRGYLIAIDINNFKAVNDLYGHDCGDVLLQSFAEEIKCFVGNAGEVSRNGGDEFQIMLRNPDKKWDERLAEFFNGPHQYLYDGISYTYYASAGSVVYPDQERGIRELYRKADLALYCAKASRESKYLRFSDEMLAEPREQTGFNFNDIVTGVPCAMLMYRADEGEEILYANEACVSMFGCESLEDFMKLTRGSFKTLVYPDDVAWAEECIRQQQADPDNNHRDYLEYRIRTKDGHIRLVTDIGRLINHEYYGMVYYVFLLDTEEQRKIRTICRRHDG